MPKRDEILDIVRGLAIILVVCIHIIRGNEGSVYLDFKILLYSGFPIAAFFVIAGYIISLQSNDKPAGYSIKRFQRICVPYFSFLTVHIISNDFFHALMGWVGKRQFYPHTSLSSLELKNTFFAFLMSNDPSFIKAGVHGSFYFFPAFFLANILFFLCFKYTRGIVRCTIIAVAAPAIAFICTRLVGHADIPWGINSALLMLPFMLFGVIYEKIVAALQYLKTKNTLLLFLCIIIVSCCMWIFRTHGGSIPTFDISNAFTFYLLAAAGVVNLVCIALIIAGLPIKGLLVTIGQNSMTIYGLHIVVRDYYSIILRWFGIPLVIKNDLYIICSLLFSLSLCICIAVLIQQKVFMRYRVFRLLFLGITK